MPSKDKEGENTEKLISRRKLLEKYGPYTAPIVVSMLVPSQAYAHRDMTVVYSTVAKCGADTGASVMGGNHGPTRPHCMFNGGGGANSHVITNP